MNVFEKLKIQAPTPRKPAHAGTGFSTDGEPALTLSEEKQSISPDSSQILRAPDGKFAPGVSPNPGGRPKGLSRADFAAQLQDPVKVKGFIDRLERVILYGSDKDMIKAMELWCAYGFGKPMQPTEISGPEGAPIRTENKTLTATVRVHDPDRMRKVAEGFLKTLPPPKPAILLESARVTGSESQAATEESAEVEPKP